MTDINTEDWTAKQYMKKSDLELTETCAKWLGLKYVISSDSYIVIPNQRSYCTEIFDWNDLMTKVVPKLILKCPYWITIDYSDSLIFTIDCLHKGTVKQGKFPDDFPRAVLELVAKLYEAESFNGQMPGGK
jgi:hypothetical protein